MKNSIFILLLFISVESFSQISLDFQSPISNLWLTKINNSTSKYLDYNQWHMILQDEFSLYNLDGTLYKTISMPPKPDSTAYFYLVSYITESLFDNDPSNIEYIVGYMYDSVPGYTYFHVKIIREDGSILLDEMNASTYNIYSTEEGTKLMLTYVYATGVGYQTQVFNLPGNVPTDISDDTGTTSDNPVIFPNPNNGSFSIKLQSKEGGLSKISLYSQNGSLIADYTSSGTVAHCKYPGLTDGLYFINIRSKNYNSISKMVIKK
jgi:hypothetical protein